MVDDMFGEYFVSKWLENCFEFKTSENAETEGCALRVGMLLVRSLDSC